MTALGLALAAAACAMLAAYAWAMIRREARLPEDLAVGLEVGANRTSAVGSVIDRLGMRWAPRVLALMGPERVERVRHRLDHAGNPMGLTVDRYAARRAVYTLLTGIVAVLLLLRGNALLAVGFLALGWFFTDLLVWAAIRDRRAEIERTLPDFLDVLAVVVNAGLGFRQALDRVSTMYKGPWSDEIRITLRQMEMGMSRRQAFEALRTRNESEQVASFVTALLQGEELGAPLTETLTQIAKDMRRTAAQEARRRAARAIPQATVVVTTILVPATILLLVVTLFLGTDTDLGSVFG